ncbi:glycerophosphodiester phosphodiesterase [Streptomyces sp. DSM 44917]|uniref:Glycerophosphodiester phosphodiesterase n=1 Tax=Streptomyces boetiae TaxID=3075541 RepID=A0ABU2L9D2_9ACTN|nr:glycerophosphodiester phosphodiesterase [Streptomyces sp. DSM 44917]MDT0308174.1 glycerophosphodiester phosphodiesterase [Streptomyces sp. DSM 44917]
MAAVTVVAHRGDPYRARENTLASFSSAVAAGADAVELDVRLAADGVPVVVHDATLKRLWGHPAPVASLTSREIAALTAGRVPELSAALAATAAVRTLIDLPERSPALARAAVAAVAEAGAGERVYWCGDPAALRAVRAADPGAEIALTWKRTGRPRPSLLAELRPAWLNYRFGLITSAVVERAGAEGYRVAAWTVDSPRAMRRLIGLGVAAITTNRPAALRALLERGARA